jgi:hypothetical protein
VSSSETAPPPTPAPDPQRTPASAWWKDLFDPAVSPAPTPAP